MIGAEDRVVEPIVAMGKAGSDVLLGLRREQALVELDHLGQLAYVRALDLGPPAVELATDVVTAFRKVPETDRVEIDGMKSDLYVDERVGGDVRRRWREGGRRRAVAQD